MLDKPPAMLTQRGLLIFYGIPAFVFGIMLFIERAQHEENPAASGRHLGGKPSPYRDGISLYINHTHAWIHSQVYCLSHHQARFCPLDVL